MYRSKELDFVSIDNYSKLYNLDYYLSSYRSEALDEDYLYELEDNKFIDLKPLIAKLIENDVEDENEYLYEFDIAENYHIIVTYVNLNYYEDGSVDNCSIEGYILEK